MLDFIVRGAHGHGPIHLLLTSAAELGSAWDGAKRGWVRLRMIAGPVQHFYSSILDAWRFSVFAGLPGRKVFLGGECADFKGSFFHLPTSSHLRERDKMLLRATLCGEVWNGFFLGKAKKEDVPYRFCGKRDGDGHLFWECTFPFSMLGNYLNLLILCPLIAASGPEVFFWHGWLPGLSGLSDRDPWANSFGDLESFHLERCHGAHPGFDDCWTPPDYWDSADTALEMSDHPNFWTDGSREDFSSVGGFEVAGAGVYLPASELAFEGLVWGTVEGYGDPRLERLPCFSACTWGLCRLFSGLNSGVLFLRCRRTGLVIWVLIALMLLGVLVACWIMVAWISLCLWSRMVT